MNIQNKLLVEVAKLNPDLDTIANLDPKNIDWDYLLEQSRFHSILQLLYFHFSKKETIPQHYKELLHSFST
jgi:hypothetical protein